MPDINSLLTLSDAELWSALIAIVLPLAISAIQRQTWTLKEQALVAFGVCLVAAAGTCWFNNAFVGLSYARCVLIVVLVAYISWQSIWKPTGTTAAIAGAKARISESMRIG
jgi:hypothetical protein